MPIRTQSAILLAPLAFACGEFATEDDGFTVAVSPPEVGEVLQGSPGNWRDSVGSDETTGAPAGLVAPGTWEMQVIKAQGPACWSGIEEGHSATLQVDSTETSVTFMDFVTTKMPDPGELVGSGVRTTENNDGCKRVETLFVEATLDDAYGMTTHMELSIEHVGESCSLSKTPLVDCSTAWTADLWAQEGKAGNQPKG